MFEKRAPLAESGSPLVRTGEYAERGDYHRELDPSWDYYPTYIAKLEAVRAWLDRLPARTRVLDAGCGEGILVAEYAGRLAIEGVDPNYSSAHVQLALGPQGTVVTVWDDGTVKTPKVVMRVSRDNGASFSPPTLVSSEGSAATFPVLALRDKDLTIAWSEQSQAQHDHAKMAAPNMKDPKAVKGLSRVGESAVRVRSGRLN